MNDIDERVRTAAEYAIAYAQAATNLAQAKEVLKPLAKQQAAVTREVIKARGLDDKYEHRMYIRFSWIDLEVENIWYEDGQTPTISVELWEQGYCGEPNSVLGCFDLHPLIIEGKVEEFKQFLMDKYETEAKNAALKKAEAKLREIEELEKKLKTLKG